MKKPPEGGCSAVVSFVVRIVVEAGQPESGCRNSRCPLQLVLATTGERQERPVSAHSGDEMMAGIVDTLWKMEDLYDAVMS